MIITVVAMAMLVIIQVMVIMKLLIMTVGIKIMYDGGKGIKDNFYDAFNDDDKAKKRKCLISGYPTDPNILGPTQTFLKPFGILKSIFRSFKKIFRIFLYKKVL